MFAIKIPQINEVFEATNMDNDIAPVVKQMVIVRIFRGISQKDMATACGVNASAIAGIETGKKLPTLGLLLRMGFVLGGTIEFTGWMNTPKRRSEPVKDEEE